MGSATESDWCNMSLLMKEHRLTREEFAALYDEHFHYLLRFILPRVAGNLQIAEDILQETFLAVLRSPSFKGHSQVKTWLTSIAHNKIVDYYRREIREQDWLEVDSVLAQTCSYSAEDVFSLTENRETVVATLAMLNPLYRSCLIMKYIDGYSLKEIAFLLKRTPKAVDSMLQRARVAFEKQYIHSTQKEGT